MIKPVVTSLLIVTVFSAVCLGKSETADYITIEDFDAFYENQAGQLPNWIDGSSNNTGTSISIYMAGCLDVFFDNRSAPYRSEVSCVFNSAQNWADSGFDTLSFLFRGSGDAEHHNCDAADARRELDLPRDCGNRGFDYRNRRDDDARQTFRAHR